LVAAAAAAAAAVVVAAVAAVAADSAVTAVAAAVQWRRRRRQTAWRGWWRRQRNVSDIWQCGIIGGITAAGSAAVAVAVEAVAACWQRSGVGGNSGGSALATQCRQAWLWQPPPLPCCHHALPRWQ
jgi:hypothetical protein